MQKPAQDNGRISRTTLYRLAHLTGWCLVALIIYGSLTTSPVIQDPGINDKTQHILAYFITMAWFAQLYGSSKRLLAQGAFLITLAIALEFAQQAGGHRHYEQMDILASMTGVLAATLVPKTVLSQCLGIPNASSVTHH